MALPLIQKLNLKNYRVFKSFEINGLRRVNMIGGLNGTGKTTFLEALFLFMDRSGLTPFTRTPIFRGLPQGLSLVDGILFRDRNMPIEIEATIRTRDICKLSMIWENQSFPNTIDIAINNTQDSTSESGVPGLTLRVEESGKLILDRRYIENSEGYAVNDRFITSSSLNSQAVFLSRATIGFPNDISARYSQIVKEGKKRRIIEIIRLINPDVDDLELLNIKGASILHAHLRSGAIIPISMVGDGAQTILSICMAIVTSPVGVIMLDEFEAAIHYSRMTTVWKIIFDLSREYNVQIFAATHSIEAIIAAAKCADSHGWGDDLAYFRLDKVNEMIEATKYDCNEVKFAGDESWEIR